MHQAVIGVNGKHWLICSKLVLAGGYGMFRRRGVSVNRIGV
jgi:hypothetical protein